MKIGEVVKKTGLTRRTIRFYAERGLISPAVCERNGRDYRDYSEEDVQTLLAVAGLRRALFSIDQIRRIQKEPESIPQVLGDYYRTLKDAEERIAALLHTAQNLDREAVTDMRSLSGAFEKASRGMPLPERDKNPHFGRLDVPEFAESPEVKQFHENQYKQPARFLPPDLQSDRARILAPTYAYNLGTQSARYLAAKSKRQNRINLIAGVLGLLLLFGGALYVSRVMPANGSPEYWVYYTKIGYIYEFSGYKRSLPDGFECIGVIGAGTLHSSGGPLNGCEAYMGEGKGVLYVYVPEIRPNRPWMVLEDKSYLDK